MNRNVSATRTKPQKHNVPSSSSYSVYGRTPLWCLHKPAAAGGTRKTCACPRAVCERDATCESSLSAGTPQTGDLRWKKRVDVAQVEEGRRGREGGGGVVKVMRFVRRDRKHKMWREWREEGVDQESETGNKCYYMSLQSTPHHRQPTKPQLNTCKKKKKKGYKTLY